MPSESNNNTKWREFWGQSVFPWVPWGLGACIYKQWKSVRCCSWRLLLFSDYSWRSAINRRTSKQCHYNYLAFCDIDTIVKWRYPVRGQICNGHQRSRCCCLHFKLKSWSSISHSRWRNIQYI